MNIQLNGESRQTEVLNLAAALEEFGYSDDIVATALNGEFIPEAMRETTTLNDGDQIEVLAPMQGG